MTSNGRESALNGSVGNRGVDLLEHGGLTFAGRDKVHAPPDTFFERLLDVNEPSEVLDADVRVVARAKSIAVGVLTEGHIATRTQDLAVLIENVFGSEGR